MLCLFIAMFAIASLLLSAYTTLHKGLRVEWRRWSRFIELAESARLWALLQDENCVTL